MQKQANNGLSPAHAWIDGGDGSNLSHARIDGGDGSNLSHVRIDGGGSQPRWKQGGREIRLATGVGGAIAAAVLALVSKGAVAAHAEIRTTSYGVPHVLADDYEGVGFGLGYAFAQTDICDIAARWVTVNAMRSRYFGPDEPSTDAYPSGPEPFTNVQSDFFWKSVLDRDLVGKELRSPAPLGPTAEVRDLVRGYAAGYNHYLAETGVNNIPDARCRGAAWVQPITEQDVYLRALHWSSFLSSNALAQDYVRATPPAAKTKKKSVQPKIKRKDLESSITSQSQGPGSNMIALGKDATDNGRGMMFANPHWVWHGPERWFEAQLTVPGKLNVYGGGLLGVPVVLFGHNDNVAWSHTLATPRRFTVYQLKLVPGSATSYLYDGKPRAMTSRTVTVDVRGADGKLEKRSHTFWETHYGTVLQSAEFGWSSDTAYAVRDVAMNFRWLNQQLEMNRAQSVEQLDEAGRKYLGIGWLNTMAADSAGNTYYADRTGVPHVTNAQLDKCVNSEIGRRMREHRQFVLDGSRSECEWGSDADAIVPGTYGIAALPTLKRTDYVTNSNDSYWTNNPHQLLDGYPQIVGDERTPRSLRTRNGLLKIERRLNGTDGYPGKRFTLHQLEAITMDNRVLSAELWRDSVVSLCRKLPARNGLPTACDVLERWDLTENLDSPGAVLWRRFFENLDYKARNEVFAVPFDPADPIGTPKGLKVDDPRVAKAFNAAISDLLDSGVPLDAKYRDYQYDTRGEIRVPMHGGLADAGQYNFMHNKTGWVPGKGWPEMYLGSTLIMWMQFTDQGPKGRSIMTYGQSDNPASPYSLDQVQLFSQKKSKPMLFSEQEILADPNLKLTRVCAPAGSFECSR
ncbi:penicillin acylase family protein [Steroidobacter flavus]|uniref:Penicillin acylase family protein n=1 Tax=Steroidobacter flavus TaxID=1842136 RepID=A0ABV8T1L0_9GAMM